jgi:formylglycine-generating enzyme required for sulfatase activity
MSEHAWTETKPRFRVAGEVAEAPSVNTADMIRLPGGTFRMGSDKHYPEEAARICARRIIDTSTSHVGFQCVVRAHKDA